MCFGHENRKTVFGNRKLKQGKMKRFRERDKEAHTQMNNEYLPSIHNTISIGIGVICRCCRRCCCCRCPHSVGALNYNLLKSIQQIDKSNDKYHDTKREQWQRHKRSGTIQLGVVALCLYRLKLYRFSYSTIIHIWWTNRSLWPWSATSHSHTFHCADYFPVLPRHRCRGCCSFCCY